MLSLSWFLLTIGHQVVCHLKLRWFHCALFAYFVIWRINMFAIFGRLEFVPVQTIKTESLPCWSHLCNAQMSNRHYFGASFQYSKPLPVESTLAIICVSCSVATWSPAASLSTHTSDPGGYHILLSIVVAMFDYRNVATPLQVHLLQQSRFLK